MKVLDSYILMYFTAECLNQYLLVLSYQSYKNSRYPTDQSLIPATITILTVLHLSMQHCKQHYYDNNHDAFWQSTQSKNLWKYHQLLTVPPATVYLWPFWLLNYPWLLHPLSQKRRFRDLFIYLSRQMLSLRQDPCFTSFFTCSLFPGIPAGSDFYHLCLWGFWRLWGNHGWNSLRWWKSHCVHHQTICEALVAEDPFLPYRIILPALSRKAVFFFFREPVHANKADSKYPVSNAHIALQENASDSSYTKEN